MNNENVKANETTVDEKNKKQKMFCPMCGNRMSEEDIVCSECGFNMAKSSDLLEENKNEDKFSEITIDTLIDDAKSPRDFRILLSIIGLIIGIWLIVRGYDVEELIAIYIGFWIVAASVFNFAHAIYNYCRLITKYKLWKILLKKMDSLENTIKDSRELKKEKDNHE